MTLDVEPLPHTSGPVIFVLKGDEEQVRRRGWFDRKRSIFIEHAGVMGHFGSDVIVPDGSVEYSVDEVLEWERDTPDGIIEV